MSGFYRCRSTGKCRPWTQESWKGSGWESLYSTLLRCWQVLYNVSSYLNHSKSHIIIFESWLKSLPRDTCPHNKCRIKKIQKKIYKNKKMLSRRISFLYRGLSIRNLYMSLSPASSREVPFKKMINLHLKSQWCPDLTGYESQGKRNTQVKSLMNDVESNTSWISNVCLGILTGVLVFFIPYVLFFMDAFSVTFIGYLPTYSKAQLGI